MGKILIAEDEEHIANVLQMMLEDEGYDVVSVRDGSAALNQAVELRPSLLITDVMMPLLDGLSLVRRLRKLGDGFDRLPVIFVSARPRPTAPLDPHSRWIAKPFDLDDVLRLVESFVPPPRCN